MSKIYIAETACDRVSTASLYDAKCSVARVRDGFYKLTGTWCTEAQALAACYSVPHNAPIDMAIDNVGPMALDEVQAKDYECMRSGVRAYVSRATKG